MYIYSPSVNISYTTVLTVIEDTVRKFKFSLFPLKHKWLYFMKLTEDGEATTTTTTEYFSLYQSKRHRNSKG